MAQRRSDFVFHPPSGSNVPGKEEANPYINYPPKVLRTMLEKEGDYEERQKMISALKQWARIYRYPGYPWRLAKALRLIARRLMKAELTQPARNIPYYQDSNVPEGFDEIIDSLRGLYDNYDMVRFDYNRQSERPFVDMAITEGDFTSPSEPPMGDVVKERGDGPDPEGMETVEPPTGGDIGRI